MKGFRLYRRYMEISIKSQMQYRVSSFLQALGMFLITGIEFLGVYALFDRFGAVRGWRIEEVALFYGFVNIIFALADALTRGFDTLGQQIRMGTFDRYLLRPRSTVLQLLGYEFTLRRAGRLLQGIAVFIWGWTKVGISIAALPFLLWAICGGLLLFCGIIIFQGCISFWTVESIELMNIFTYGGVQTAHYPLSIYGKGIRIFFLFIVPIGLVTYFPITSILERNPFPGVPYWIGYISPLSGFVFFALSLLAWRYGVRHYTSTGS